MTTDIHDTDDMVRRPLGPLDYERMARDVKSHEECRWTAVPPIDRLRARQGLGLSLSEVAALCTAVGTKTTEGQVAKWETTEFPGVEDEAKSRAYRKVLTTVALV